MNPNTPKPPKKNKAAKKHQRQTTGEGGRDKATKGVVEKKEKQVTAKGAGVGQPKRGKGNKGGGERHPQASQCGSRTRRGWRKGWWWECEGGEAQVGGIRHRGDAIQGGSTFVLCHRGDSHRAMTKGYTRGAEATQQLLPTQADEAASHPQPPNQQRPRPRTPSGPHPRSPPPGPPGIKPGTPTLFGSPHHPPNSKGHPLPLWVSLSDIHVTMGVQHVKGCCVLHVCVLTGAGKCSI